ncbi:MAG: GNAT family N-acetyltransferase [Verrucomicrobiaceae bacterium]|nr:MAG: GNAT family N-acetyltransferase [Verrucomicrobiaceae bacterium]
MIGHDGEMAGCLQTRQEADHLYVLGIGLHPRFQGRGIGAAVMDAVKQRAASMGLPVRLSVFRTNPRALEFYLRLGFRQTGESESGRTMEWQPPQD